MKAIKDYLARRGLGFYFSVGAALLAAIQIIVYVVTFSLAENANLIVHVEVWLPCLFAVVAYIALNAFKVTERYSVVALFGLVFISFLMFILNGYMYLTDVFYNGINAASMASLNGGYVFSLIAYLLILIFSGVSIFIKQNREVA